MQLQPSGISLFRSIMHGLPVVISVFFLACSAGMIQGEEGSFAEDDESFTPKAETVESKPSSINVTGPDDAKPEVVPEEMPDDPEFETPTNTTVPVIPADEFPVDDPLPPKPVDVVPMGGSSSESSGESLFKEDDDEPGATTPRDRETRPADPRPADPRPSASESTETNRSAPRGNWPPARRPDDDEFPVRPERGRDSAPASDAVGDSPSGSATDEADYSRCQFSYSYKGPFGVFHLTNKGGSAHYRTLDGKRFLSMLAPPSQSNPQQTIDLPICCKKFVYFIPDPGCGDPSIIAWAFSREPCGPNGYVAMKHTGGKWQIHSWCRRDVVCDSCFPPAPPTNPSPQMGGAPCGPMLSPNLTGSSCFGGCGQQGFPSSTGAYCFGPSGFGQGSFGPGNNGSGVYGPGPQNMGGYSNGYETGNGYESGDDF